MNHKKDHKKAEKLLRRRNERNESKRGFKFLMFIILSFVMFFVFATWQQKAQANSLDFTYYAKSYHLDDQPYNEEHRFIGLELRNNERGLGIANFKNSYRINSRMFSYSEYWQSNTMPIEYSLSANIATGYEGACPLHQGAKYCPVVAASIAYTEYPLAKPKLSIFGGALVFSISARF